METLAVVLHAPGQLELRRLAISSPQADDVVVETGWSGISAGTERLLWSGRMPDFPGMGYPLVPGYESVGRIVDAGMSEKARIGSTVFVPGASCFGSVRGLFGGAAATLVVPSARAHNIGSDLGEHGVLLALAATARHAIAGGARPDLIVGHGVLGRILARLALLEGGPPPTVWERDPERFSGAEGYGVVDPANDPRRDYRSIYDVSGDGALLDELIARLAPGGEIVLAGFYSQRLGFSFPPAFMREARLRIAAQWQPADLAAASRLVGTGKLSLDGLITHREPAANAGSAYRTAFDDPACLKMILDWKAAS